MKVLFSIIWKVHLLNKIVNLNISITQTVIPSVLDGGSEIVLANMLNEKRLICTYDQGLAKPLPASPYVLVDRRLLCHCHIQSGLTYVLKTIGSCNSN